MIFLTLFFKSLGTAISLFLDYLRIVIPILKIASVNGYRSLLLKALICASLGSECWALLFSFLRNVSFFADSLIFVFLGSFYVLVPFLKIFGPCP